MQTLPVHKHEQYNSRSFWVVRLAGSGAGGLEQGDVCSVTFRGKVIAPEAVIADAEDITFGEITDADADRVGADDSSGAAELRSRLREQYGFRPQWSGDRTVLRFLRVVQKES